MAVTKKEIPPPSCPMWLATYGDLVTNMLVFFVLLVSMSEIKQDDKFEAFMEAMRETFGYLGGLEVLPTDQPFDPKNVDLQQLLMIPIQPRDWSEAPDPGVRGKQHTVTDIRRGEKFAVGGKYPFAELSAELQPELATSLDEYASKLRGMRNQIEVRGHCSRKPVDGTPYADHMELSLARARTVAAALIARGVEPERIVVVGAGTNEPVNTEAYAAAERYENDRVEVYQVDRMIEEFDADEDAAVE
jgi:chemotaxis protein MotB